MEKSKILLPVLMILLGSAACRSSPTAASPPTSSAATRTAATISLPSIPPSPTATGTPESAHEILRTSVPSPTPIPDVSTAGPYLAFRTDELVLYDLDGAGRRAIPLPDSRNGSLSPDFHWYAHLIYTQDVYGLPDPASGIELFLVNLWTGNEIKLADLIPDDFEERQTKMIEEYSADPTDADSELFEDLGVEPSDGYLAVDPRNVQWSPDSRYLAFPAMIDGNSTDIYVYDVTSKQIRRKDDSTLNVAALEWSPDGKWILFSNHLPYRMDPHLYSYSRAIHMDSPRTILIKEICYGYGGSEWVSGSEFIRYACKMGEGGGGGRIYDIRLPSGIVSTVWDGDDEYRFAVDPQNKTILFNAYAPCSGEDCYYSDLGLYFGPLLGTKKRIAEEVFPELMFRGGTAHRFIDTSEGIVGITAAGDADPIFPDRGNWRISISPDYRWMAVYGSHGVILFDESDGAVYRFEEQPVNSMAWDTNIAGFFFVSWHNVYRYFLGEQTARVLLPCLGGECEESATLSLISDIFLRNFPSLRAQPPSMENPTQGTSLWTKVKFEDLPEPGAQEYTVTLPAYSEWRWDFSWCAATEAGLAGILEPFEIAFSIGGEPIGEDIFRIYDTAKCGSYCRTWATLLSGWQPGDQTDLTIRYTLREAVYDGTSEYPPGEYRQIMHVTVTG